MIAPILKVGVCKRKIPGCLKGAEKGKKNQHKSAMPRHLTNAGFTRFDYKTPG